MNFFHQNNHLSDQLFCMKEERNFFQSKYTEQVKEIEALKKQLELASNEIIRLRSQVMQQQSDNNDFAEEKKTECVEESPEQNQDKDEEEAIRRKASSLLQWAEFRENSPGKSLSVSEHNDDYDDEPDEDDSFTQDEDQHDAIIEHEVVPLSVLSALTVDSGDPF